MQFLKYIGMLFNRAAQNSVLLTDRLTIFIVPFATLGLWLAGAKMTDSIQETLLLGVAMTVIAVVALRLIAASYFVWKEDQAEKSRLQADLDAPDREARASLKLHTIDLRKRLSEKLGRLAAYAVYPHAVLAHDDEFKSGFNSLVSEIDTLVNQLSYDFPVRVASLRLRDYCLQLIKNKEHAGEHFWQQRRLTFRLLHKEDAVADFMTLMELEVLLEDAGFGDKQELDAVEELKAAIRQLGPKYHEAETQQMIRDALATGTSIRIP